jgi:hypothetical protein
MLVDIDKLRTQALDFLSWWKGELLSCIPFSLRQKLEERSRGVTIRPRRDSVEIDVVTGKDGRTLREDASLDQLDDHGWAEIEALLEDSVSRVALPDRQFFRIGVSLPVAAARNIRQAIELQLPLISPLLPSAIVWGYRISDRSAERIEVSVVLARKAEVDRIVELFDARGLVAPPIEAVTEEGSISLRPGKVQLWSTERRQDRIALAAGIVLLATIPLTLWAGSSLAVWLGARNLETLRAQVAPRSAAERRAEIADARRRAIAPLTHQAAIAPVLDDLAVSLPETTYLENLRFGGREDIGFVLAGQVDEKSGEAIQKASQLLQVTGGGVSGEEGAPAEFRARVR